MTMVFVFRLLQLSLSSLLAWAAQLLLPSPPNVLATACLYLLRPSGAGLSRGKYKCSPDVFGFVHLFFLAQKEGSAQPIYSSTNDHQAVGHHSCPCRIHSACSFDIVRLEARSRAKFFPQRCHLPACLPAGTLLWRANVYHTAARWHFGPRCNGGARELTQLCYQYYR